MLLRKFSVVGVLHQQRSSRTGVVRFIISSEVTKNLLFMCWLLVLYSKSGENPVLGEANIKHIFTCRGKLVCMSQTFYYIGQKIIMENNSVNSNPLKGVISLVALIVLGWYFWGGGMDKQVNNEMKKIENSVALDAVSQYEIAARGGDKMQMYTQASLCAAAFLQAKDEVNYRKWLSVQHTLAKEIGMPE